MFDVAKLGQMFDSGKVYSHNLVNYASCLAQNLRVFEQQKSSERQKSARGFVTSYEERHHLVANVFIVQLLASFGIDTVKHSVQQIALLCPLRIATALGHQLSGNFPQ